MPNLLSEQEFTERFTEALRVYNLTLSCKEPLILELHYGDDEPVLSLSLKEAFAGYQQKPDELSAMLQPYIQDICWTVQPPRYGSKEIYEHSLPTMRNFYADPPRGDELAESCQNAKGPIVFDQVLKSPGELVVMQFNMFKDDKYMPLRKGDILPCIPDAGLLAGLALHNLALFTEPAGITATPLKFASLKAQSWLIGLGDDKYKPCIAALSCITPIMASLEETFRARNGLIAIMPATDQLIVSIDTGEDSICELGLLAQQLSHRAPNPLSCLIWTFAEGKLMAVQSLELEEIENSRSSDGKIDLTDHQE